MILIGAEDLVDGVVRFLARHVARHPVSSRCRIERKLSGKRKLEARRQAEARGAHYSALHWKFWESAGKKGRDSSSTRRWSRSAILRAEVTQKRGKE